MRTLAIIPARAGSKGVKNKNIRLIDGKPLIEYAINSSQESKKLSDTIVSTDSPIIAEIAAKNQINTLIRPKNLALDETPISNVISHILNELQSQGKESYDLIILLQPTAPIRTGRDIDNVIEMFSKDIKTESVISVVEIDDIHPARMYVMDDSLKMNSFLNYGETSRRQDLKKLYLRNGCIYAIRTKAFLKHKSLIIPNKKGYIMPLDFLANVDNERDLVIVDTLVKIWKQKKSRS